MRDPGSVAVLAYDGMSAFETGIVTEVFGIAWPEIDVPWYTLTICTESAEPVRTIGGAGTVIVPSVADPEHGPSAQVVAALRQAHDDGARLVSICTGAFALAG